VRVVLVGSGAREHALAWSLSQSSHLTELHAAPGNPGIARLGQCHPVRAEDGDSLLELCRSVVADLVVVGPEAPLVAGVADHLRRAGIAVFGPSGPAARIEGSKSFAKEVMEAAKVPTAATLAVAKPPCVVKVDGLAAGKGVFVCHTQDELDAALLATAGTGTLVIEELLEGEEISLFALCDGRRALPLAPAQDYKRAHDGDLGPNTGGMGAYSPVASLSPEDAAAVADAIHGPVLDELAARGTPFLGLLYAGLMQTDDGIRVLEFNCRFGDPETQAILPRLEGDLLEALAAAAAGDLAGVEIGARDDVSAVTVVVAAGAYPESGDSGTEIHGIPEAEEDGALVFHAGTALRADKLVTNGGRIRAVTACGDSVEDARDRAYAAVEHVEFEGARYRTDIGRRGARVA
jgi:phosphoribosylamine--glycine ligase